MKLTIHKPLALNQIGGRENNEDTIYPEINEASQATTLFLVCDGIGGHAKGEVASKLACLKFSEYFEKNPANSDENYINAAFEYVQNSFDAYIKNNTESKGMGTTLTLLHLHQQGVTVAHCGDSRVYHIRNNKILHQTSDHSEVNEMIKHGILTKEEAKNHPKKNVIIRAIQGNSVKKTTADTTVITDLKADDYFFMCTDGILEQINDNILISILSQRMSNEQKLDKILNTCKNKTKDNFSCYLVQLKNIEGKPSTKTENISISIVETEEIYDAEIVDENQNVNIETTNYNESTNYNQNNDSTNQNNNSINENKKPRSKIFKWLIILIPSFLFLVSLFFVANNRNEIMTYFNNDTIENQKDTTKNQPKMITKKDYINLTKKIDALQKEKTKDSLKFTQKIDSLTRVINSLK